MLADLIFLPFIAVDAAVHLPDKGEENRRVVRPEFRIPFPQQFPVILLIIDPCQLASSFLECEAEIFIFKILCLCSHIFFLSRFLIPPFAFQNLCARNDCRTVSIVSSRSFPSSFTVISAYCS